MQEAGGRRIKRSIDIDVTSVRFCDEAMIGRLRKIDLIKEHIELSWPNLTNGTGTATHVPTAR